MPKVKSIPAKTQTPEIMQFRDDLRALLMFQDGCGSLQEAVHRFLLAGYGINSMEQADLIPMFDRLAITLNYFQILLETEPTEEKMLSDSWLKMMLCLHEHKMTRRLKKTSTTQYQQYLATVRDNNKLENNHA